MQSVNAAGLNVDPAVIGGRWTWFFGFGVVLALLGVLALANAVDATLVTTSLLGLLLLGGGIIQAIGAFSAGGAGGTILRLIIALLYGFAGFQLLTAPITGALTIAIIIAIMLIVNGLTRLIAAFVERPQQWGLIAVGGLVNLLLGVWLWTDWPVSALAIGIFVGIDLLFAGIAWITLGLAARRFRPGNTPV
jgi:uncharacterized membrane protein HdeD (DUF308 family)